MRRITIEVTTNHNTFEHSPDEVARILSELATAIYAGHLRLEVNGDVAMLRDSSGKEVGRVSVLVPDEQAA